MVLGVVASDGKKCLIIIVPDGENITPNSYQALLHQYFMLWLSAMYPERELRVPAGWRARAHCQFDAEAP
jgi:hypothetical protein